jgi:hypothetical protein
VVRFEIVPGMRYQIGELDIGNINHVPDAQQILRRHLRSRPGIRPIPNRSRPPATV